MPRPTTHDYASFYHNYVMYVLEDDVRLAFQQQAAFLDNFLSSIPESKADYAYAEGKWTVKQLLQHIIDAERIFTHRALWFARHSPAPLSGFDENEYARHYPADKRTLQQVYAEFKVVRDATIHLFQSLNEEAVLRSGIANGKPISVSALGYAIVGHANHHFNVIKERYL
mgnify:CR=1 FL=1